LSTLFVSSKTRAFYNREGVGRGKRVGEVVGRGMKWGNERRKRLGRREVWMEQLL